jgi:hypothetical protein
MRLWTVHPRYLDARGLVAAWREALLAQKVLRGATKGYRHHPQLERFKAHPHPVAAIAAFLRGLCSEAQTRGYRFDAARISRGKTGVKIKATHGQLQYERDHLQAKLRQRDPRKLEELVALKTLKPHPLFRLIPGGVEPWEVITVGK